MDLPEGVDVASYQGNPDWNAVKADGIAFAFTKATQGTQYLNPFFASNWPKMQDAGLYRGSYHFPNLRMDTPETEAEHYMETVGYVLETGDLLALDWEEDPNDPGAFEHPTHCPNADWAVRFLERLRDLCGFNPLIYTRVDIIQRFDFMQYADRFSQFGLWLASWRSTLPPPPPPWDVVAFWQDGGASVSGINGMVDHDYFNGSAGVIPRYGKPEEEPPPVDPCEGYKKLIALARDDLDKVLGDIKQIRDALGE